MPKREELTGLLEEYIVKNNQKLRLGYTTGSCAAAAAKASCEMLLGGGEVREVSLMTPKGILLSLAPDQIRREEDGISCCIYKDGGDDPDATNGIAVFAEVRILSREKNHTPKIIIDGGKGVGRVTLPGLDQPVGEAAINRVPREMIRREVLEVCEAYDFFGELKVVISVPKGEEIAGKTFNPRLGIVGGISILGTSGIVEPMSEKALVDSIKVEMNVLRARGVESMVLIPGNYGTNFSRDSLGMELTNVVKCSNFIGEAIDHAVALEVKELLLIGHIGKFIKLAGGIMNTHSRNADCRTELLTVAALTAGGDTELLKEILAAGTTDEAIRIIKEAGLLEPSMKYVMEKAAFYVDHRCQGMLHTEVILFSNVHGILGMTEGASEMLSKYQKKEQEQNR